MGLGKVQKIPSGQRGKPTYQHTPWRSSSPLLSAALASVLRAPSVLLLQDAKESFYELEPEGDGGVLSPGFSKPVSKEKFVWRGPISCLHSNPLEQ